MDSKERGMEAMDEHTVSEQAYKRGLEDGKPK
jgi:hypothetical protein